MGRTSHHPVRKNSFIPGNSRHDRQAKSSPGSCQRKRSKFYLHIRPLPPSDRQRPYIDRLRWRPTDKRIPTEIRKSNLKGCATNLRPNFMNPRFVSCSTAFVSYLFMRFILSILNRLPHQLFFDIALLFVATCRHSQ